MRAFAEFVMRGRMQATLGVVGSAAFPLLCWLSAAGGSLVLLRRGLADASGILFWASLPALLWWYLGNSSVFLIMAGTVVLAQVLRSTASWTRVLLSSVLLGAVFILVLSTVSGEFIEPLAERIRSSLPQLLGNASAEELAAVQESLIPALTGAMASSLQVTSLLCLALARYWQAALYNPGGFGQEFRAIRLSPVASVALLLGMLFAPSLGPQAAMLATVFTVPLLFAGVALGHGLIAMKRLSSFWVFGLYVAVLLLGNLICLLAVIDGLFDFRGRLARKNGAGPANGEG